jgi:hypothetical protein
VDRPCARVRVDGLSSGGDTAAGRRRVQCGRQRWRIHRAAGLACRVS